MDPKPFRTVYFYTRTHLAVFKIVMIVNFERIEGFKKGVFKLVIPRVCRLCEILMYSQYQNGLLHWYNRVPGDKHDISLYIHYRNTSSLWININTTCFPLCCMELTDIRQTYANYLIEETQKRFWSLLRHIRSPHEELTSGYLSSSALVPRALAC